MSAVGLSEEYSLILFSPVGTQTEKGLANSVNPLVPGERNAFTHSAPGVESMAITRRTNHGLTLSTSAPVGVTLVAETFTLLKSAQARS